MQKSTRNASILIWTIFLSIIISMAFLGISTKIHKNIKNSGDFIATIDNQNKIGDYINASTASWSFRNKIFDNTLLSFEDQRNFDRAINTNGSIEIKIQENIATDIQLQINSGGPVIYKYINSSNTLTSSWVIHTLSSFSTNQDGSIFIKNLWWHTNFSVISNASTLLPPNIGYTITRRVWNLDNIQSRWLIQNFISWDF